MVLFEVESVVLPNRIFISYGFSDLPKAPAPLCDNGLLDMRVNVKPATKTTITTTATTTTTTTTTAAAAAIAAVLVCTTVRV